MGYEVIIFPARVGMNLPCSKANGLDAYFPRASGDEPETPCYASQQEAFSPREWG